MKAKKVIELEKINKNFLNGDVLTKVLHDVSFSVDEGEFISITGPSGSGKSTLLNILGLLDDASTGEYILNGENVTKLTEDEQSHVRNREIGFVFQSFNLLQRSSVLENVVLPSIYAGMKRDNREEKAKNLLSQVGLGDQVLKRPNQLSGGQQQRVAIARSLINDPAIVLADEPTGNLDSKSGHDVMEIIKKLNKEGRTIIMITHDMDIAKQAQRIIHIRDGKVEK
jgi:putative ABC transport system ATP-binding protein